MSRCLTIIGASGHGSVVADVARLCGYDEIVFLDDDATRRNCAGWPVVGRSADAAEFGGDLFVAVGDAGVRRRLMDGFPGRSFPVLAHPSAVIARGVILGEGTVVMAGAVVQPGVMIGRGCIVNTCASVDHDCELGDFVHVAVGAHLCGSVAAGDGVWVGAGATVSNGVSVCDGVVLGVGAVVVRDITVPGTYVGVPASRITRCEQSEPSQRDVATYEV